MTLPQHPGEAISNRDRAVLSNFEPKCLRTFTPSLALLARSAGVFHWTPEGRQLYDFTSGVLVANLGHNPRAWQRQFEKYLGWTGSEYAGEEGYFPALPLTSYNAATEIECEATRRLVEFMRSRPGGARMEQVLWAASGSEAIQKALWACLAFDRSREMILATRHGFHGKKGLANAVTGSEIDRERDPRVRFIAFPMEECRDVSQRDQPFDFAPYARELDAVRHQFGRRVGTLITEPYLGGGGSFHPPRAYLPSLQAYCREHDILFVLDEVQANFGRTGDPFAFESYRLEPDLVVLGKGMGNGVPVAAVVGRKDVLAALHYGEGSDTWSANALCCAAVLATLDAFAHPELLASARTTSAILEAGLRRLQQRFPFIAHVRGEPGGMVWGIETRDHAGATAAEWANRVVLACYRGDGRRGIHLLGPLAQKVVRISPPLVLTPAQAEDALHLFEHALSLPNQG